MRANCNIITYLSAKCQYVRTKGFQKDADARSK